MADLFGIRPEDALAEIDREIALRKRVYPKWISAGRLSYETADIQLKRLEAARTIVAEGESNND